MLFLNKVDLLKRKLEQGIKFNAFVKSYTGPNECDPVCKYMKKKFLHIHKERQEILKEAGKASSHRIVKAFLTSALDLQSTREVVVQVETTILHDNLSSSNMI